MLGGFIITRESTENEWTKIMKRNKRRRLTAWISGALVTVVIGCGGPSTVTPQDGDNEQVDATETAKSDVTADSSSQENANVVVDAKPKEVATAKSAPTETTSAKVEPKPVPPPSFQQVVDVLDLRTAFDILPNAGEINRDLTSIYYSAPATFEQAVQSYTEQLTSAGWKFEKEVRKDKTAQMSYFLKDGFRLMLNINRGSEEGHVGVSLDNSGPIAVGEYCRRGMCNASTLARISTNTPRCSDFSSICH